MTGVLLRKGDWHADNTETEGQPHKDITRRQPPASQEEEASGANNLPTL